jgi:hypothetical protein
MVAAITNNVNKNGIPCHSLSEYFNLIWYFNLFLKFVKYYKLSITQLQKNYLWIQYCALFIYYPESKTWFEGHVRVHSAYTAAA